MPKYSIWYLYPGILCLTKNSPYADKPAQRDVRYIFGSVGLRYIFCNYRKAKCTPSTAGEVQRVISPRLPRLRCLIALFSTYCP